MGGSRNQGDRIEIFGLGETNNERKWIYSREKTAYVGAAEHGGPTHSGESSTNKLEVCGADPAIETDKHELSLGRCPGPTRTFIVHIWRLTRILERGPIPQNGSVIVLSRSSSPDPEQYDGNRHIRM